MSARQLTVADYAAEQLDRMLEDLLRERAAVAHDDLLSTLLEAERGGALDRQEVISLVTTVLGGGSGTAAPVLLRGLETLRSNLALCDHAQADEGIRGRLCNEMLRIVSPVRRIPRTALRDVLIDGQIIVAGDTLTFLIAAANRDTRVYRSPDEVFFQRRGPRPLSFGGGIHVCPGATLMRSLFEVVVEAADRLLR